MWSICARLLEQITLSTLSKKEITDSSQKHPPKLSEILRFTMPTKINVFCKEFLRFWYKGGFVKSNMHLALKCCILRDYISAMQVSAPCKFFFYIFNFGFNMTTNNENSALSFHTYSSYSKVYWMYCISCLASKMNRFNVALV